MDLTFRRNQEENSIEMILIHRDRRLKKLVKFEHQNQLLYLYIYSLSLQMIIFDISKIFI